MKRVFKAVVVQHLHSIPFSLLQAQPVYTDLYISKHCENDFHIIPFSTSSKLQKNQCSGQNEQKYAKWSKHCSPFLISHLKFLRHCLKQPLSQSIFTLSEQIAPRFKGPTADRCS